MSNSWKPLLALIVLSSLCSVTNAHTLFWAQASSAYEEGAKVGTYTFYAMMIALAVWIVLKVAKVTKRKP